MIAACLGPAQLKAQSVDNALAYYRSGNYEAAALGFYDVFINTINPDNREQAEIYLAESLNKLEIYLPAYYFYAEIFKAGPHHRYYLNAIQGLLAVRTKLRDNFLIPSLINQGYNGQAFSRLPMENINEINYLIGSMTYRQGKYDEAAQFLAAVKSKAGLRFHQARYILALIALQKGDTQRTLELFQAISEELKDKTAEDWELHRIWQLATLGMGRTLYGSGRYQESVDWYNKIPRFDSMWYEALSESAWAYFQLEDPGHALGQLQSLLTPYFNKHLMPEPRIIQATTYYINCQWDRVRSTLSAFKNEYQPILDNLNTYLNTPQDLSGYYNDVVATGNHKFAPNVAIAVRRSQRFLDFHHLLTHLAWEDEAAKAKSMWTGSQLLRDIHSLILQHQQDLGASIGIWTRSQLEFQRNSLKNLLNQADIIEFEVIDTEKRWLEAGQNIIKGRRARLPRPDIPSDQWQHWNNSSEHWLDELGYYVHSVKSECIEGM